jgi:hypothetical protein
MEFLIIKTLINALSKGKVIKEINVVLGKGLNSRKLYDELEHKGN